MNFGIFKIIEMSSKILLLFDKKLIIVFGGQLNILKNTSGIFSEFFFHTFKIILSKNLYFEFIVKLFTF